MKKLLILSLSIFLFACNAKEDKVEEQRKNTDVLADNLKGKVDKVETSTSIIDSLGVSKDDSTTSISVFDSIGYLIESYTIDAAGKKVSEQMMKRNADGSMAEYTTIKDGKNTGAKTYDSTGNQIGYYTDITENDYGQVATGTEHFMDGRVKSTFISNFKGPLFVGGSSTDSTGKENYTGTVTLDDKGNPISENYTTMENGVSKTETITYTYEYDSKGNWIARSTFNDKRKPTKITRRIITYY
jgi:hypothetical protein